MTDTVNGFYKACNEALAARGPDFLIGYLQSLVATHADREDMGYIINSLKATAKDYSVETALRLTNSGN